MVACLQYCTPFPQWATFIEQLEQFTAIRTIYWDHENVHRGLDVFYLQFYF